MKVDILDPEGQKLMLIYLRNALSESAEERALAIFEEEVKKLLISMQAGSQHPFKSYIINYVKERLVGKRILGSTDLIKEWTVSIDPPDGVYNVLQLLSKGRPALPDRPWHNWRQGSSPTGEGPYPMKVPGYNHPIYTQKVGPVKAAHDYIAILVKGINNRYKEENLPYRVTERDDD